MSAPLIVTPEAYEWLRAMNDREPPDAHVLVQLRVPMHWPAEKPWPPQVTLPAAPCWRCAARRTP